jgi:invasion protein IalB
MSVRKLSTVILWAVAFALLPFSQAWADPVDGDAYENWLVSCKVDEQDGRQGCFIVQNLVLREGGQRVLQVAIGFVDETPEPIALISLPLGISLPPGTTIQVDKLEPTRIPIERCEPNGCRAGLKLGKEIMKDLLGGDRLSVTFYDAKRQPIEVPLSLKGIEEGLAALARPEP